MRERHSCISHESNVDHNALRSWHATMHKFVTSMVRYGLGMQQCAMHNATIQRQPFLNYVYLIIQISLSETSSNYLPESRGSSVIKRRRCKKN